MTTAVVDSTEKERALAGQFRRRSRRPGCRWVQDPHGEHAVICVWLP